MKHLKNRYGTVFLACSAFLAGCNQAALKDPSSPYAKVPVDTSLEIKQPITVAPGSTRVFIQWGKISRSFDRYVANCNIEVTKIDWAKPQSIEPGVYRVSRVQPVTEEIVEARPVLVASLSISGTLVSGGDGGGMDEGGSTMIYEGYHLWLDGPDPNVRRLTCRGSYDTPSRAVPPSINEIRQALGDLMTLGSTGT